MRQGFYARRVFPWLNDAVGRLPVLERLRHDLLGEATGRVVEVGFGTGANLPWYPPAVTSVAGIEPSAGMTDRARGRLAAAAIPVHLVCGVAEALPFADASFDTAVSTLTLCSVDDPRSVLRELRRVLRPGTPLLILEHGLAEDPAVARWQHRLNGLERVVACGCNLNRPIARILRDAGFDASGTVDSFVGGVPRTHGWFTVGRAVRREA